MAVSLLAGSAAAGARNVVANAEFDDVDGTTGWVPQYFNVIAPGCLGISPGQTVYLDFDYIAPGVDDVRSLVRWYSSANCTTGSLGFTQPLILDGVFDWTRESLSVVNLFSAAFARLEFDAWRTTDIAFYVAFDRVDLGARRRIFADDFDGSSIPCRWSLVAP